MTRRPTCWPGCGRASTRAAPGRSVVAQRLDQLGLGHRGAALDADLPGPLDQVFLAPVGVGGALAALLSYLLTRASRGRVGDPGRLLLAVAFAPQRAVRLLVLDLGSGHGRPPAGQACF